MNLLYIHQRSPYPIRSGMDKFSFNLIRTLAKEHYVTFVYPCENEAECIIDKQLLAICEVVPVLIPKEELKKRRSRKFKIQAMIKAVFMSEPVHSTTYYYDVVAEKINQLLQEKEYRIIQASSIFTECYLIPYYRKQITVLGPIDDVLASAISSAKVNSGLKNRISHYISYRARKQQEKRFVKNCNYITYISATDLENVKKRLSKSNSHLLHCPVDSDIELDGSIQKEIQDSLVNPEKFIIPNQIIFMGNFAAQRVQHAIFYFVNQVLPLILKIDQGIILYIVGKNPQATLKKLASENIVVTGEVTDNELVHFMLQSAVFVAPSVSGAGIKTKTLHAMSLGKAIVASSKEVSGFKEFDPEAIKVCDDAKDFAHAVLEILGNPFLRNEMGKKAYKLYKDYYSSDALGSSILRLYSEISLNK